MKIVKILAYILTVILIITGGLFVYGKYINPAWGNAAMRLIGVEQKPKTRIISIDDSKPVPASMRKSLFYRKVQRDKNVCTPINNVTSFNKSNSLDYGKRMPTFYSCFSNPTPGLKDKNGSFITVGVDFQSIINDVTEYVKLPNIEHCMKQYNYNTTRVFREQYKNCGLGYYHDMNGMLTLMYTNKDGVPATVQQNLKIPDDGDETTFGIQAATFFKMKQDYKKKVASKGVDVTDCAMKISKGNVDLIESKCGAYGVYTPSEKFYICALLPNTYGKYITTERKKNITVNVSKSGNLISVCALNEDAMRKAAEEARKRAEEEAKKQQANQHFDAEGHDIRPLNVIVEEIIQGKYENGARRMQLLGARYSEAQKMVNHKCLVEKDPRCVIND